MDDPNVRMEWFAAHRNAAEARFLLQPQVLRAYAEAQLACEKWDAKKRGRKPSGDLRYPVQRDRLDGITAEMTKRHEGEIARAERIIRAISSGDVLEVQVLDMGGVSVPILRLQSDVDRKTAEQQAKANRTFEEIEAGDAEWSNWIERMVAELPRDEPELQIPNLPDLPMDREPSSVEVAAFCNAIRKHLNYVERGEQIEAQRQRDGAVKVRTAARREAERADPERTAAAKQAAKLAKAADRQRRWRERRNASKATS